MKNFILFILIQSALSLSCLAQETKETHNNKPRLKISLGSPLNIYKNQTYTDGFEPRNADMNFMSGITLDKKFKNNLGLSIGLQLLYNQTHHKFNDFQIPQLRPAFVEWCYRGNQLSLPINFHYYRQNRDNSKVKFSLGALMGLNTVTLLILHQRTATENNPERQLIGLSSGHERDFTNYLMYGINGGIEYYPSLSGFLGNLSFEVEYQIDFSKMGDYTFYVMEENVDLGILHNYRADGSIELNRFIFKMNYTFQRSRRRDK